jgi:hypothetical protein
MNRSVNPEKMLDRKKKWSNITGERTYKNLLGEKMRGISTF